MRNAGRAGHACDTPQYRQKDHNLDCHPGASTGILGSTLALPAIPAARAVREAVEACTRIFML
jgi:hypothetical protein